MREKKLIIFTPKEGKGEMHYESIVEDTSVIFICFLSQKSVPGQILVTKIILQWEDSNNKVRYTVAGSTENEAD